MSEEIKPVKSERIDNPDGSYVVKEVFDENPDGFLSWIIQFDKKERPVKFQEFFDKEFKELYITETRKYDIFNSWISDVIQENYPVRVKRYYKNGKLIKEENYNKEKNELSYIKFFKYYKNGQYKIIEKYDKNFYDIHTYDADGNWIKWEMNSEKRIVEWQYINKQKCKETVYENNKIKSSTDFIYGEKNQISEEKTIYYTPEKEEDKYFSKIRKYNINDKYTEIKYFIDNNFENLLKTEKISDDEKNVTMGNYIVPYHNILSYITESLNNGCNWYLYKDSNFKQIYYKIIKEYYDEKVKERIITEKPTKGSIPHFNFEISEYFMAIEAIFSKKQLDVIFYSDKELKMPVCYSTQRYLRKSNTCLFYNSYPQENYVEVRKYKNEKLIYVKQYKKFKFLAKLRYYFGI